MAKYYYPVIFYHDDTDPQGNEYFIGVVPDLQGCLTQGNDLQSTMNWIVDAIGTWLCDIPEKDYPTPTPRENIDLKDYPENAFINIIEFDSDKYFNPPTSIKEASQKNGKNIKDTAKFLNAPYRTIQNWFDGTRTPPKWIERLVIDKLENYSG